MMTELDPDFVERYAKPPAPSTVAQAKSLQENLRVLLGETDYLTFLQGSYKNDTALADINDVDIVVLHHSVERSFNFFDMDYSWRKLFENIEQKLDSDPRYSGKWERRDKSICVSTGINIDIVPAIHDGSPSSDPIVIHSFKDDSEKKNWPRDHYARAAEKNQAVDGAYKRLVRLYKKWARCCFKDRTAPSYFLECLLYSIPDTIYSDDLAATFVRTGNFILEKYGATWGHFFGDLPRVAGQGNILEEWDSELFDRFRQRLQAAAIDAEEAIRESSSAAAMAAWRRAFNGY